MAHALKSAFRLKRVRLAIELLSPSRSIEARERNHEKYRQIAASIRAVGVIEPLVVFPLKGGTYRILDGHKRHDIVLGDNGKAVDCVVALEDENYTYNRRANYLAPISEHQMILRALQHNTEERIATALNVDVGTIRKKRDLLNGICKEAVEVLKEHRVTASAFDILKRMKAVRQVEAAQVMVASNTYTGRFAAALLTGTRDEMLVAPEKDGSKKAANPQQRMRLQQEADNLLRDLKSVEESYGAEVLTLSVSCKYVARLVGNARLRSELKDRHPDVLDELDSLLALVKSEVT
jgi:hypothetical protein